MSACLGAATLNVPAEYPSIQGAIDASSAGDTVLVGPGLYFERINFNGKDIIVTSQDPNNPTIVGYTVLNAEGEGSVVTFQHGESARAVLTGFTITGGVGTLLYPDPTYKEYCGAGIYCQGAAPTITHNVIANNVGPYLREEVQVEIDGRYYYTYNYEFSYGGGIYCTGPATIRNNLVYRNVAYRGGGLYCSNGADVSGNLIYDNSAIYGGGVYFSSRGRLVNNTIVGNDADLDPDYDSRGGNVYASFGTDPARLVAINNIICDAVSGGGFYWTSAVEDAIRFNNVWNNFPGNYVSLDPRTGAEIYDGDADWTGRHGNISADPVFTSDWGRRYRLDVDSPCVSAGDPAYLPAPGETDIDGDPRVFAMRIDIGADERVGYVKPLAQAGPDRHVLTPEPIVLDATASYVYDPNGAMFQWMQTSGPAVTMDDPMSARPVVTPSSEGWYTFQLTVGDGQYASEPDEILLIVGNERPVADAGPDGLRPAPGNVKLDGKGSYDADPPDTLTYAWTQIDGTPVTLNAADSAAPVFDCPESGVYRFQLIVNDGFADSEPDVVKIEAATFTASTAPATDLDTPQLDCFYPSASGTMIAYSGMDYTDLDWDIYCTNTTTGQTQRLGLAMTDAKPVIDGGTVAWVSGTDYFLYELCTTLVAADLATGTVRRLQNARTDVSYGYPAISGNRIAYLRHYDVVTGDSMLYRESPYDICIAGIADMDNPTFFTIAAGAGHGPPYPADNYNRAFEGYVDISGDMVVWEGDGDIYGADISDLSDVKVFAICTAPQRQYDPAISGSLVVWTDERNDAGDVYGADISDPNHVREFEVYVGRGSQLHPDVDGTLIAFVDGSESGGTLRACYYSPQYGPSEVTLLGYVYGAGPSIDGANIAWWSGYRVAGTHVEFGYDSTEGPIRNVTTGQRYDRIQYALVGANDGDVILVPEGTYEEKLRFSGRNVTLTCADPTDPAVRAATILTGGGQLVSFADGESADCLLTGFTLTGGSFGIYCGGASPSIQLCDITGNRDAGIKLWGASRPAVDSCNIIDNGVGVELWALAMGRQIPHNYPVMRNCLIAGNRAEGVLGSNPTLENCTIADNGSFGVTAKRPIIANSIVYFNNGGGPNVEGTLQLTVTYSDIQRGAPGPGNIDADPLFRGPGDYHLQSEGWAWDALQGQWTWDDATSPCIDAADPAAPLGQEIPCDAGDAFSERAVNDGLNMGAYGGTVEASLALR